MSTLSNPKCIIYDKDKVVFEGSITEGAKVLGVSNVTLYNLSLPHWAKYDKAIVVGKELIRKEPPADEHIVNLEKGYVIRVEGKEFVLSDNWFIEKERYPYKYEFNNGELIIRARKEIKKYNTLYRNIERSM